MSSALFIYMPQSRKSQQKNAPYVFLRYNRHGRNIDAVRILQNGFWNIENRIFGYRRGITDSRAIQESVHIKSVNILSKLWGSHQYAVGSFRQSPARNGRISGRQTHVFRFPVRMPRNRIRKKIFIYLIDYFCRRFFPEYPHISKPRTVSRVFRKEKF